MKNMFNIIVITVSFVVAFSIYQFYFGNPNNFDDPSSKKKPKQGNIVGAIYTGGPIVAILMGLIIIVITFTFERYLSINKAKGKGNTAVYLKKVMEYLKEGAYDDA